MRFLRYKAFPWAYRIVSWLIKHSPLPDWVTIKTKYGTLIHPKSFRIITVKLDLVEPEIKEALHEALRKADVFVDVGAAYGYYTLKAARLMREGLILAFEPDPVAYAVLQANLAINHVTNVKTYNLALGDKDGRIIIAGREVPVLRLDTILNSENISLTEDSVIKIDVEGMALQVLKGAEQTLGKAKPKLFIELHPGEEQVPEYLGRLGYKVRKLSEYFIIAQ